LIFSWSCVFFEIMTNIESLQINCRNKFAIDLRQIYNNSSYTSCKIRIMQNQLYLHRTVEARAIYLYRAIVKMSFILRLREIVKSWNHWETSPKRFLSIHNFLSSDDVIVATYRTVTLTLDCSAMANVEFSEGEFHGRSLRCEYSIKDIDYVCEGLFTTK